MNYVRLTRLDKPIGILLLLWPTLWGLWASTHGHPNFQTLVIFVTGVILTRSTGCIINDIADCSFDRFVQRTQQRPLATGVISLNSAYCLAICLGLLACTLLLFLNTPARYVALFSAIAIILYPFSKRVTYFPQFVLGIAFGACPVIMAFTAQNGTLSWLGIYLAFVATLWPIAYDTIYAMIDREDDRKIGVKSTALKLGNYDRLFVGSIYVIILLLLVPLGFWLKLNSLYYIGLLGAAGSALYTYSLTWKRDPFQCLLAFQRSHWFGFFIFMSLYWGGLSQPILH